MCAWSRPTPRPTESRFTLDELFFSTTDKTGKILSGNHVFARISGYTADTLVGSPHSIIRHPDMPRSVFALLWSHLKAGKAIAAYVKNMAADGSFYWVCALAAPIDGGYLSIRMKPSSALFPVIQEVYLAMREAEAAVEPTDGKQAAIDAGAAVLAAALVKHGFQSYDELMHAIFVDEVRSRRTALGITSTRTRNTVTSRRREIAKRRNECRALRQHVSELFGAVSTFLDLDVAMKDRAEFTAGLGRDVQMLSLNAQVRAAGLADAGRTLQVIAEHMSHSAGVISTAADEMATLLRAVSRALRETAFDIASVELAVEMMDVFLTEVDQSESEDLSGAIRCVAQLSEVSLTYLDEALRSITGVTKEVRGLEDRLEDFMRQVRVLEILHVTGKTEAVRQPESSSVASIFEDIRERAYAARQKLSDLATLVGGARIKVPASREMTASLLMLRAV